VGEVVTEEEEEAVGEGSKLAFCSAVRMSQLPVEVAEDVDVVVEMESERSRRVVGI